MTERTPHVSVIVPTYERPAALARCLEALAGVDYPRERFEVVVVDDGGSAPIDVDRWSGRLRLKALHQPNAGPAAARNAGAARADGAILAFTDDDCLPHWDWLRRIVEPVAADPSALAGGRTLNGLRGDPYAAASQLLVDFLYEEHTLPGGEPQFFTSNNLAVNAGRFRELGGFDAGFPRAAGEDRDFCDHWRHAGGHLRLVPDAIVSHAHHLSLRRFWRQHFAYGTGAWRFHRARAKRQQKPPRVEPLAFYGRLLLYPFHRVGGARALPLAGLMLLSQVANATGYFMERQRGRGPDTAGPGPAD